MSSPTVDDPIQAITVPLLLMTTGGLYLLADHGGPPVANTWPALLILSGVLLTLRQLLKARGAED
jgi:hypothetical protein